MIIGIVKSSREAVIRFFVRGSGAILHEVEAVVDTGFTEELTLPAALVKALGLPFETFDQTMLSDGSIVPCAIHRGVILWDGAEKEVLIQVSNSDPLVGMSLLYGNDIHIVAQDNGQVQIFPLASP